MRAMVLRRRRRFPTELPPFSFESPHPRAMHLLGRPYQRFLWCATHEISSRRRTWNTSTPRRRGLDYPERISAAIRSRRDCERCPSRRASTSRSIDSPPRWAYSWASSACSAAVGWWAISVWTPACRSLSDRSARLPSPPTRMFDSCDTKTRSSPTERDSNSWACGSVSTANHCATSRTRAMARGGVPRRETRRIRAPTPIARRSAARTGARKSARDRGRRRARRVARAFHRGERRAVRTIARNAPPRDGIPRGERHARCGPREVS